MPVTVEQLNSSARRETAAVTPGESRPRSVPISAFKTAAAPSMSAGAAEAATDDSFFGAGGGDYKSGLQRSVASAEHLGANAAMLLGDFREWSRGKQAKRAESDIARGIERNETYEEPGIEEDVAEFVEKNWRERSQHMMELAEANAGEGTLSKIKQVAGALPVGLLTAATAANVAGPVAGFAGMGGLGAADTGDAETIAKESAKGALLGAVLKTTGGAPRLGRMAAVGGTAGAISEGEPVDRAIEASVMAMLSAGGKPMYERKKAVGPLEGMKKEPWQMSKAEFEETFEFHAARNAKADQSIRDSGVQPGSYYTPVASETLAFTGASKWYEKQDRPVFGIRRSEIRDVPADEADVFGQEYLKSGLYRRSGEGHRPEFEIPGKHASDPHGYLVKKAIKDGRLIPEGDQSALAKAREKIAPGVKMERSLKDRLDGARQGFLDDTFGIERAERSIKGEIPIATESATKTARLSRSKYAVGAGAVQKGGVVLGKDGVVRFEGPGLIDITNKAIGNNGSVRDFVDYMVGLRAAELKGRGKENNFTEEDIAALKGLETPEYVQGAKEYQAWNRKILQFAVDNGAISQKGADAMSQYFYIPFFRENRQGMGGGKSSKVAGDVRATSRLTGKEEAIRDPIDTMHEGASRLIDIAMTNDARLKIVEMAELPAGKDFLKKVPKGSSRVKLLREDAKRSFKEEYEKTREWDENAEQLWEDVGETLSVWQRGRPPKGEDLMAVLKDGKAEYYEVQDPLLMRSILALDRKGVTNPITKVFRGIKNLSQYTITRTPQFMEANIARDQIHAGVLGRRGFKPFLDGVRGFHTRVADMDSYYNAMKKVAPEKMVKRIEEDRELYRLFVANGGALGGLYGPEITKAMTARDMRTRGLKSNPGQWILDSPAKLKHALDEASMSFELATRLGSFRRDVKAGVHPKEAGYEARDLTDFQRRGDYEALQFFLDTVPFMNAAAQGLDRFFTGAYREPAQRAAVWRRMGYLSTLSMANAANNRGNPIYENESDASKDFYSHFLIKTKEYMEKEYVGGGHERSDSDLIEIINNGDFQEANEAWDEYRGRFHHIRYPKVWEIGAFMTMSERAFNGVLDNQPKEAAERSAKALLANLQISPMPAAIEPFAESLSNKDFFTWRDIIPKRLEGIDPEFQYKDTTPLVLRDLGEKTGVSPIQAQHFVRSFLNTWGTAGLQLADWGFFDQQPDISMTHNPFTERFARSGATGVKPKNDLYQLHRELGQAASTFRFLRSQGEFQKAFDYRQEHPEISMEPFVKKNVKALQHTGEAVSLVQNSRTLEEVQEVGEAWVSGARGDDALWKLQASPVWKNKRKLKTWLMTKMRQTQNLRAHRAMQRWDEHNEKENTQ